MISRQSLVLQASHGQVVVSCGQINLMPAIGKPALKSKDSL
jgi:hypothetical protein